MLKVISASSFYIKYLLCLCVTSVAILVFQTTTTRTWIISTYRLFSTVRFFFRFTRMDHSNLAFPHGIVGGDALVREQPDGLVEVLEPVFVHASAQKSYYC